MSNSIKINSLELENVKRVTAVSFSMAEDGLTLIGGNNAEGKTSILDAICYLLGGNKHKPSGLQHEGSMSPAKMKLVLSNGLVVERKGKKSNLTVTDPSGELSNQTLLNSFISELALDLPSFMQANDKKKAATLLKILGVGDQLAKIDAAEQTLTDERLLVGRDAKSKRASATEILFSESMPEFPVTATKLLEENSKVLQKNTENQTKRNELEANKRTLENLRSARVNKKSHIDNLKQQLQEAEENLKLHDEEGKKLSSDIELAEKLVAGLVDESTEGIEAKIRDIDEINAKVRTNMDKAEAEAAADILEQEYKDLTEKIEDQRKARLALIESAKLPLPELTVSEGCLLYKNQKWDCMSGAEQLIVSTAIVRALKPECGFVLMDKLEQMDSHTLKSFNEWCVAENLQIIGTTVGDREECQIIIEDGKVKADRTITLKTTEPIATPKFTGDFK